MQHSILSASQTTGPLTNWVKRVGTNARIIIVYSISLRFTDHSFSLAVSHLPTYLPYTHHHNVPKFCSLMNMTSKSKNVKLAKFISCIFEVF